MAFAHIPRAYLDKKYFFEPIYISKVNIKTGNGIKEQNNVSVYKDVEIEDDVFFGSTTVFTNVVNPHAFIQCKDEFKKTLLKRGRTIGANATIVCGVTIGCYAMIGTGVVVTKDVPDFALMAGVPEKRIWWVSNVGNWLEFDAEDKRVDSNDSSKYRLVNQH